MMTPRTPNPPPDAAQFVPMILDMASEVRDEHLLQANLLWKQSGVQPWLALLLETGDDAERSA